MHIIDSQILLYRLQDMERTYCKLQAIDSIIKLSHCIHMEAVQKLKYNQGERTILEQKKATQITLMNSV